MQAVSKYPIGTTDLKKGDVIPFALLESITGYSKNNKRYQIEILKIKEFIEKALAKRNLFVTVVIRTDELCILTDEEASGYNDNQISIRMKQAIRAFERLVQVDIRNLANEQIACHKRRIEVNSKYIQSIESIGQQVTVTGHKRKTPGLTSA